MCNIRSEIVQKGYPSLHTKAEPVREDEFGTPELLAIIAAMKKALACEEDGAAIAAPQIGISKRIFVIAENIFGPTHPKYGSKDPHLVFINPEITKLSKKTAIMDEGCLSVRGTYGNVRRAVGATISARDEYGVPFIRGAGGLLAQVFQHETDHLNGVLFIDRALETWDAEYPKRKSE